MKVYLRKMRVRIGEFVYNFVVIAKLRGAKSLKPKTKNQPNMKTEKQTFYQAPELCLLDVVVEQGFTFSNTIEDGVVDDWNNYNS